MSLTLAEPDRWSNRRLSWIVALLFALHLSLVFFLSEQTRLTRVPRASTSIRWIKDQAMDPGAAELLSLRDPTLLALVSEHGFSGTAWLNRSPFPYHLTNRSEPPQWLGPSVSRLAEDFVQFVGTNATEPLFRAEKPRPSLSQMNIADPVSLIRSVFRLEGGMAGRRLISTNALPPPEPGIILTNCVIQVLVSAKGYTLSHALLWSSGSARADENALNFAKAARFAPLDQGRQESSADPGRYDFGTFVFQWLGTGETGTNRVPAKP